MKVAIIGGGASGLICAIESADKGHEVVLFEKDDKIGKKILVTGNGRCNLSNKKTDYKKYNNPVYAEKIISQFNSEQTIKFFNRLGLATYPDSEGRVYPITNMASSVLDVLRFKLLDLNVKIFTEYCVNNIELINNKFIINNFNDNFDKVILCCGNIKNNLLKKFGHNIIKPMPSIVGFMCKDPFIKQLSGVRQTVKVSFDDLYSQKQEVGEIQFKDDGISGICVMNMSSVCARKKILPQQIYLDLLPQLNEQDLLFDLQNRKNRLGYLNGDNFFVGLLHKNWNKIINNYLKKNKIDNNLINIVKLIKKFPINIIGNYKNNQVVSGGYDVSEFDTHCQSKIVSNLYCVGEALNIDGECGGYNLQFAWSSAMVSCMV